jgi:hypothetical protein
MKNTIGYVCVDEVFEFQGVKYRRLNWRNLSDSEKERCKSYLPEIDRQNTLMWSHQNAIIVERLSDGNWFRADCSIVVKREKYD